MASREFSKSIRDSINLITSIGLLRQAGNSDSLNASRAFKALSRSSKSYLELYDFAVHNQEYNMMLDDQSFFQFTEIDHQKSIRFAHYPNPYKHIEWQEEHIEATIMLNNGDLDHSEYEQILSESTFSFGSPIVRYDLSLEQYCEKYHPAAHFHIGFISNNRWPVKRKLTPLAFVLKIIFVYYPDIWKRSVEKSEADGIDSLDDAYSREKKKCMLLDPSHFSSCENDRLYFS